jgi:hypothetical protein
LWKVVRSSCKLYHAVDRFVRHRTRRVLEYLDMRWTSALDLCMFVHYMIMIVLYFIHLFNIGYHGIGHDIVFMHF